MNIIYYDNPFPHAVIENFYTEQELNLIWDELKFLTHPRKMLAPSQTKGAMTINGVPLKNNHGLFLDVVYSSRGVSDILTFSSKIFSHEVREGIGLNNFIGKFLNVSNKDSTLISYYENGDSYGSHADSATLTACTWLYKKPKQFSGGNFSFTEFDYTVPLEDNKLIIFPSVYRHEVEKVVMNSKEIQNFSGFGRYTITNFIFCNG